jgi:hypothetical protein
MNPHVVIWRVGEKKEGEESAPGKAGGEKSDEAAAGTGGTQRKRARK